MRAVDDGLLPGDEFLDLHQVFSGDSPACMLLPSLAETRGSPDLGNAHPRCLAGRSQFAALLGSIKDGQKVPPVTFLGGTAIMARFEAIAAVAGHGKVSWTMKHLLELDQLCRMGKTVEQMASHFSATVAEIERGCRRLAKRRGESLGHRV
jgi:hypothetical protein